MRKLSVPGGHLAAAQVGQGILSMVAPHPQGSPLPDSHTITGVVATELGPACGPVCLVTSWGCCLLMAETETGSSPKGKEWACFIEVPQVHRIVILIILLIKVCWNYWILHIRFSQRFPYVCYGELQLIYMFCKYSSSQADPDCLWMI